MEAYERYIGKLHLEVMRLRDRKLGSGTWFFADNNGAIMIQFTEQTRGKPIVEVCRVKDGYLEKLCNVSMATAQKVAKVKPTKAPTHE